MPDHGGVHGHRLMPQCPHCGVYDVDVVEGARGDDRVVCRMCGFVTTYARAEEYAAAMARRRLALRFGSRDRTE